mgnify:CR=1 FL=1
MSRKEEIVEESLKIISALAQVRIKELEGVSDILRAKMQAGLLGALNTLAENQRQGSECCEKEICYLCIEFLLSSIVTRSYDERLHLDPKPCAVYWRPPMLFDKAEEDMEDMLRELKSKVIALRADEAEESRKAYLLMVHYLLVEMFVEAYFKDTVLKSGLCELAKEKSVELLYGGYMDKMKLIGRLEQ